MGIGVREGGVEGKDLGRKGSKGQSALNRSAWPRMSFYKSYWLLPATDKRGGELCTADIYILSLENGSLYCSNTDLPTNA
jgi:hypothetical protein